MPSLAFAALAGQRLGHNFALPFAAFSGSLSKPSQTVLMLKLIEKIEQSQETSTRLAIDLAEAEVGRLAAEQQLSQTQGAAQSTKDVALQEIYAQTEVQAEVVEGLAQELETVSDVQTKVRHAQDGLIADLDLAKAENDQLRAALTSLAWATGQLKTADEMLDHLAFAERLAERPESFLDDVPEAGQSDDMKFLRGALRVRAARESHPDLVKAFEKKLSERRKTRIKNDLKLVEAALVEIDASDSDTASDAAQSGKT